jgi:hypothetical protein
MSPTLEHALVHMAYAMKRLCKETRFQTLIRPIPDQIRITSMSDHRLYPKLCDAARKAVARYITHAASDYAAVLTVVSSDQTENTTSVLRSSVGTDRLD